MAAGPIYYFAHWVGHYNGDLCRDCDVTFVVTSEGICPLEYQQDMIGAYTETATVSNGKVGV